MEIFMYLATETCGKVHGNFRVPFDKSLLCVSLVVHGNFHVPCNETFGKVHGNRDFHVPCNETCGKVPGNFRVYFAISLVARYMEISFYFVMCFIARYMEISMYLATKLFVARYMEMGKSRCKVHGNVHVPCQMCGKRKKT